MPSSAERDHRILAGYRAGAPIPDLRPAEKMDHMLIPRVLRWLGIVQDRSCCPGPTTPGEAPPEGCLQSGVQRWLTL